MSDDKPWLAEPDRLEWRDPFTGYDCLLRRTPMAQYLGHLCGYVRVPEDHPLYGLGRSDPIPRRLSADLARVLASPAGKRGILDLFFHDPATRPVWMLLNAHGGVTWAGQFHDDPGWWFGFDCGHAGDLSPGLLELFPGNPYRHLDTYRTVAYVEGECASLAAQLHRLATPAPLLLGFDPATLTESPLTDDRHPT